MATTAIKKQNLLKLTFWLSCISAIMIITSSCGKDDEKGDETSSGISKNLTQAEYASAVNKAQDYINTSKVTINGTIVSTVQGTSHTETIVVNIDSLSKKWSQFMYTVDNGKSTLNGFVYQDDKTVYTYQKMYTSQTEFTEGKYIQQDQGYPNFNFDLNQDVELDNGKTQWKVEGSVLTGTFSEQIESGTISGKIKISFNKDLRITAVDEEMSLTQTTQGNTFTGNFKGNYTVTYGTADTSFPSGFNKSEFTQEPPKQPNGPSPKVKRAVLFH